ncbi:MAG: hypothetical protein M1839_006869 [Geoglossum umbratile]|nr:MAG: hypothetical protein M1839_006869 [Geoglossum umbratile]
MIAVPGRVLSPPSVMYHTKRLSLCADGTWYIVQRDRFSASVRFSASARLAKWSYLKITYDGGPTGRPFDPQLPVALANFKNVLQSFGMIVPAPTPPGGFGVSLLRNPNDEVNAGRLSEGFEKAKEAEVRFLLVILRDTNRMTYARVKRLGDAVFGIHTICVVGDSFVKNSPAYMANVALKANLKMGGRNQELGPGGLGFVGEGRTMIVGIDVTHPSPESAEGAPSIAGVVASVDAKLAHWPASIRIQEGRKEMVDGLEDMVIERLKLWRQKNNQLPVKVLVYRDGVSEGQYGTVLAEELPCIKNAFKRIYPTNAPQPKLSIVVVGKRHHTRFYPVKENETDRTGNPSHGTIVDRGVTYDRKWDFFLQAHHSLKGTARPAHYVVLFNEMGLGVDVLEQLTHNMCYLFGRSTVPVSICPPAYYADILCERGRCYIYEVYNAERTVKTVDRDQIKIAKAEIFKKAMAGWGEGVHGNLKDTMFYL